MSQEYPTEGSRMVGKRGETLATRLRWGVAREIFSASNPDPNRYPRPIGSQFAPFSGHMRILMPTV